MFVEILYFLRLLDSKNIYYIYVLYFGILLNFNIEYELLYNLN